MPDPTPAPPLAALDDPAAHAVPLARVAAPAAAALLTLWCAEGGGWRARVVTGDGQVRDFSSPFELARWSLARAQGGSRPDQEPTLPGLR